MKRAALIVLFMFTTIVLDNFLNALFENAWNMAYDECKEVLQQQNNLQSEDQVAGCVHDSSAVVKYLGPVLWKR